MIPRPPRSTLMPCTTLFRSVDGQPRLKAGDLLRRLHEGCGGHAQLPRLRHVLRIVDRRELTPCQGEGHVEGPGLDRKSTRLNSSHANISYAVFCLQKKT